MDGPGTSMLAVGRVHTLYMRGQLTRIPGAPPSGFGRSVRAPRKGTVNPPRHPKAVEPRCQQGSPGEQRGPGTVMLAVERVNTLYMQGQLTRIPGTASSDFGSSVRAPRIGTVNPHRQPKRPPVEPHCHQGSPGELHGPETVKLAVGPVYTLYMWAQLTRIPGTASRKSRSPRIW